MIASQHFAQPADSGGADFTRGKADPRACIVEQLFNDSQRDQVSRNHLPQFAGTPEKQHVTGAFLGAQNGSQDALDLILHRLVIFGRGRWQASPQRHGRMHQQRHHPVRGIGQAAIANRPRELFKGAIDQLILAAICHLTAGGDHIGIVADVLRTLRDIS